MITGSVSNPTNLPANSQFSLQEEPKNNPSKVTTATLIALGVALVSGNVYFFDRVSNLQNEVKTLRGALKTEITSLHADSTSRTMQQQQALADLRLALEQTGAKSYAAASQASTAAKRYSEALAKRLAEQQDQASKSHEQLVSQLGEMKDSATSTTQQVSGIASDVTSVKHDVTQTKSELEKTILDLRSVRGDLGVQSGLIATNAQELAALKALGDREYIEFELMRTKAPQKVGDVALQLKKWDSNRNRYTLELIADDKRVEKRDRSVNEPVQFYTAKARIPYEIVINEVRKDRVVGYMSAPKLKTHAGLARIPVR